MTNIDAAQAAHCMRQAHSVMLLLSTDFVPNLDAMQQSQTVNAAVTNSECSRLDARGTVPGFRVLH